MPGPNSSPTKLSIELPLLVANDQQTHPPFHFTDQLDDGKIRLLRRLSPIRNVAGDTVLCFQLLGNVPPIRTSDKSGPAAEVKYSALSYVWGDETNKVSIIVDDQTFEITKNFHTALTHLADEHDENPFWVDAVCINQTNQEEKLVQIAQMSQVYAQADRLFIFLGPGDRSSDRAMDQLQQLGQKALDCGLAVSYEPNDRYEWGEFANSPNREEKLAMVRRLEELLDRYSGILFSEYRLSGAGILALLERPWFGRVWVVQELLMARNGHAVFACGCKRLDSRSLWAGFFAFRLLLKRHAETGLNFGSVWAFIPWIITFRIRLGMWPATSLNPFPTIVLGMRAAHEKGMLNVGLKDLLTGTHAGVEVNKHMLQCKERADRIRAFVSMSNDKEDVMEILRAHPDSADWRGIYRSMARLFIKQGHVDILALCRERDPELPSWAPDWSIRQRKPWSGFLKDITHGERLFDTGAGTTALVYENVAEHILALNGLIVDTIAKSNDIGSEWQPGWTENFTWEAIETSFNEIDAFLSRSSRYSQEREEALAKIPIGDKGLGRMAQWARAGDDICKTAELMRKWAKPDRPLIANLYPGLHPYRLMMLSMYNSRPFISSTGYVGLCPSDTQPGDAIFAPCGCHVPYVIRPKHGEERLGSTDEVDELWTLVGRTYVHGIMDGELRMGEKPGQLRVVKLI